MTGSGDRRALVDDVDGDGIERVADVDEHFTGAVTESTQLVVFTSA